MDTEKIVSWLVAKQGRKSRAHLVGGIGLLILSVPALVITYGVCCGLYGVIIASLASCLGILEGALVYTPVAGVVILILCFTAYRKANRDTLGDLSFSTGTASDKVVHIQAYVPGVGRIAGSTVNPLAPNSIHSMAKIVTTVLLIAPALSLNAINKLVKAWRVRTIAFADAARVIAFLDTRPHRVTYSQIMEAVPGIDPSRTFRDLGRVEGVLTLVTTRVGLSLNDRLRSELNRV